MTSNSPSIISKNEGFGQAWLETEDQMDNSDNISWRSCPVLRSSEFNNARKTRPKSSQHSANVPRLNLKDLKSKNPEDSQKHANAIPKNKCANPTEEKSKVKKNSKEHEKCQEKLHQQNKPKTGESPKKCKSKFCGQPCASQSPRRESDILGARGAKDSQNTLEYSERVTHPHTPIKAASTTLDKKNVQGTKSSTSACRSSATPSSRNASFTVISPKILQTSKSVHDASTVKSEKPQTKSDGRNRPSFPLRQAKETVAIVNRPTSSKCSGTQAAKKKRTKRDETEVGHSKERKSCTGKHVKDGLWESSNNNSCKHEVVEETPYESERTRQNLKSKSEEFVPLEKYSPYFDEHQCARPTESRNSRKSGWGEIKTSPPVLTLPPITLTQPMTVQIPLTALSFPPSVSSAETPTQAGDTAPKTVEASVSVESSTTQTIPADHVSSTAAFQLQNAQTAETQTIRQTFRNAETNASVAVHHVIPAHSNSGDGPTIILQTIHPPLVPQESNSSEAPSPTTSATAVTQTSGTQLGDDFVLVSTDSLACPIVTTAVPLVSPPNSMVSALETSSFSPEIRPTSEKSMAEEVATKEKKRRKRSRHNKSKDRRRKHKHGHADSSPPKKNIKSRGVQVSLLLPPKSMQSTVSLPSTPASPRKPSLKHVENIISLPASSKLRHVTYSASRNSSVSNPVPAAQTWQEQVTSSSESFSEQRLREISAKTLRHSRLFNEKRRSLRKSPAFPIEAASCQRLADVVNGIAQQKRPPLLDVVHRKATAKTAISVNAKRKSADVRGLKYGKKKLSSQKNIATAISRFLQQLSSDKDAIRVINNMAVMAAKQQEL